MNIAITAIGTATPCYALEQQKASELIADALHLTPDKRKLLKRIYKGTGIDRRYSVLSDYCKQLGEFEFFPNAADEPFPTTAARMQIYKANASKLAITAIENCFANLTEFDRTTITHLVTVSCTGMYAPGLDIELVQQLGLNSSTKRTTINFMGCYGAFNGLKLAESVCKADPNAKVLLVCVELCTIHFQKNDSMDSIVSNAIFADGAAAALIQVADASKKHFSLTGFHCDLLAQSTQEMTWEIADFGFDIVLTSYVPALINSGISTFVAKLLEQQELTPSAIDFFAIHPGGFKILQACQEALQISAEQNRYAYQILRDHGNMSSPTVLFVLKAIWDDISDKKYHDKTILSCAFGPGLTLESMLLKTYVS